MRKILQDVPRSEIDLFIWIGDNRTDDMEYHCFKEVHVEDEGITSCANLCIIVSTEDEKTTEKRYAVDNVEEIIGLLDAMIATWEVDIQH